MKRSVAPQVSVLRKIGHPVSSNEQTMKTYDELLEKELYEEAINKYKAKSAVERAEIVIRTYCNAKIKAPELRKMFENWLSNNASIVLQTEALEMYFNMTVYEDTAKCKDMSKADRDMIAEAQAIIDRVAGKKLGLT